MFRARPAYHGSAGDRLASPMDIADPRALREVLRRHGVRAATSLGQRFLVNRGSSRRSSRLPSFAGRRVLEVGPGPGVLTSALASRVRSVTAVEVDPRMVALLERRSPNTKTCGSSARTSEGRSPRPSAAAHHSHRRELPYQITTRSSSVSFPMTGARRSRRRARAAGGGRRMLRRTATRASAATSQSSRNRSPKRGSCAACPRGVPPAAARRLCDRLRCIAGRAPPSRRWAEEPFLRLVSDAFRHRRSRCAPRWSRGWTRPRACHGGPRGRRHRA